MGSLRIGTQRLGNISKSLFQVKRTPIIHRNFAAYEAEGKTYAKVLNKGETETFCVDSVSKFGFVLTNQMVVLGPTIIFPHTLLSWNVDGPEDINEDSLSLFSILQPKIEMVIIGFGSRADYTKEVQSRIFKACKELKLNHEAMATEDAIATFNFLSLDRRFVAGAFIPPKKLTFFGLDQALEEVDVKRLTSDTEPIFDPEFLKRIPDRKSKEKERKD